MTLRFAGYAALFDKRDSGRDVIRKGAFARTLGARKGPIPLYWQHKPDQRIGWIETADEDERGLRVVGSIDNPDGGAGQALQRRTVSGLSFGYAARDSAHGPDGRELLDVELVEVSLVTHPMQHGARVHLVEPAHSSN